MKTKKMFSKVFALLLAAVMVLAMGVTAFAAEDNPTYSISISGAANGETYTAYKVFDATVDSSVTPAAVAYTIKTDSAFYDTVSAYTEGFTLTPSASDASVVVVTQKNTFDAATFAQKLAADTSKPGEAGHAVAANGAATIDVSSSGAGYYFVDTNLGSLCSLDTVSGTDQEIKEKNSKPTIAKKVAEDGTDTTKYVDSTDIDIIDTIHYQLTVNTGTNTNGTGTGVDGNYVITDTLPAGVTYTADSINVEANGTTWAKDTDYTVSTSGQVTTITLLSSGKLGSAAQNTNIVITYTATVTTKASVDLTNTGNTNTASITYKNQTGSDTAVVKTFKIGQNDKGEATFVKEDGTTKDKLANVVFVLSNSKGEYAKLDANGFLTSWVTDKTDEGAKIKTDSNGNIVIKGIDSGDYTLTETSTLPGYNILTSTISVKVTNEGVVTYKNNGIENATYENSITVDNNKGTALPSTGGIGTTIFYVIGTVMVAGALVLLVVKKRMSNYQD